MTTLKLIEFLLILSRLIDSVLSMLAEKAEEDKITELKTAIEDAKLAREDDEKRLAAKRIKELL